MTHLVLLLIRLYQFTLSSVMGTQCRYHPTCSHYAAGAVRRFGPGRGLYLGLRRVLRCHPWAPGGHDPVPETFPRKTGGDMLENSHHETAPRPR